MGVMCSLLGHDYDDPEVERERDENGDEVVLTAKRVQRCESCGHERTISENTEVTALSAAAGVVREPDGTVVVGPAESTVEPAEDLRDAPESAGAIGTAEDDRSGVESSTPARNDGGTRTAAESERDDGTAGDRKPPTERTGTVEAASVDVDGESGGSTEPGGGVIADSVTAESALDRPTNGTTRAGLDDSSPDGGASIDRIGDEPTRRDPPQRAPGEWPTEPARPSAPATGSGTRQTDSDDSAVSATWPGETDVDSDDGDDVNSPNDGVGRVAGGSFVCGSCGFDAAVIDSPHRAGDICPNCHRGYLAWETRKG